MTSKQGQPERILVRGVNWVGDTILAYPAVERLKALFPRSRIAVLAPDYLAELWETFPAVDEVITFKDRKGIRSFPQDLFLGLSLRKKRFDLAVILPRSFRSALQVSLAGIPVRIGYRSEGRSAFLTHGVSRNREVLRIHRIHYYERLVERPDFPWETVSPRISLRPEDRRWAEEKLGESGLLDGRTLIGINPGATYGLAKCWHPERFGELGRRLAAPGKASILLFGKASETPMAEAILPCLGERGVSFLGKTSLLQLAALLERCRLLVTNDTGTMHVAAAVGTRVAALFGSTDPVTTGPWGEGHIVVRKDVSCSPCLKRFCPTDHRCMDLITVDDVEKAVGAGMRESA